MAVMIAEFLNARLDDGEFREPSPADVMLDVAAKRAIVVECEMVLENKDPRRVGERLLAWTVLRQLASVHRGHPDWRESWQ